MPVSRELIQPEGFTLIELVLAMAIFGFMLLLIVAGFINVVRLHNEALASNSAQDSARTATDAIVQAVRGSSGVVSPTVQGVPSTSLCLASASGADVGFYVASQILYETTNCSPPYTTSTPLTSSNEEAYFNATLESTNASDPQWKPEVQLKLEVAPNNGYATWNGTDFVCQGGAADLQFCSVVKLITGAEPR
jgi:prepilin-type N-terminal cleavage/methylation domain-containing protein